MSLLDIPPRYPRGPTKYIPGKSYWGYNYSGYSISAENLQHKFTSKGRPNILASDREVSYGVGGVHNVLSIVSKYPKKHLAGIGEIRSGGNKIDRVFGEKSVNIAGLYRPQIFSAKATIDLKSPADRITTSHELAHHIQSKHLLLGMHIPSRIGGPTMHADKSIGEDFAETTGLIQTGGKKRLASLYEEKMKAKNLNIMLAYQEGRSKKPRLITQREVDEAINARKKTFDFAVRRYGIPRSVPKSTESPPIPASYQAGKFIGKIEQPSEPEYKHVPGTTGLATASTNAYYGRAKVPGKASEYAGSPEEADKEAEALFPEQPRKLRSYPLSKEEKAQNKQHEGYGLYYMKPVEFLGLAATFGEKIPPKEIAGEEAPSTPWSKPKGSYSRHKIDELKEKMLKKGAQFETPWLIYDSDKNVIIGHEGRHRAYAAQELGIKKIPVEVKDTWRYQTPHFTAKFNKTKVLKEGTYKAAGPRTIMAINRPYEYPEAEKQVRERIEMDIAEEQFPTSLRRAHIEGWRTVVPELEKEDEDRANRYRDMKEGMVPFETEKQIKKNYEEEAEELYSTEPFVKEGRAKQKPLKNEEAKEATDEEILEQLYPEG